MKFATAFYAIHSQDGAMGASWSGYAKPKFTISVTNGFQTNIETL